MSDDGHARARARSRRRHGGGSVGRQETGPRHYSAAAASSADQHARAAASTEVRPADRQRVDETDHRPGGSAVDMAEQSPAVVKGGNARRHLLP